MPQNSQPPAADLPGVVVIGHRLPHNSTAPFPPDVITGSGPLPGSDMEIGETTSLCEDPETREEINADAAAAAALAEVHRLVAAAGETFATREYAALIVRNPDGSIGFARMTAGPGGGYGPTMNYEGIDWSTVVGDFHTHVSGTQHISVADWAVYNHIYEQGTLAGADMTHLRMYVASQSIDYESVLDVINLWKGGNWGSTIPVVKVNPEAMPCGS